MRGWGTLEVETEKEIPEKVKTWSNAAIATPLKMYRMFLSPLLPDACRFEPTCSLYAIEAIEKHGPLRGIYLSAGRILRCRPFGGFGYDPVPGGPESTTE